MDIEAGYIAAINAFPDDRVPQLMYADWLEEQGDPRGEAWRVLIEEGKRPAFLNPSDSGLFPTGWHWWIGNWDRPKSSKLDDRLFELYDNALLDFSTFHAAMNAAAIAWLRAYRDPDYEPRVTDPALC